MDEELNLPASAPYPYTGPQELRVPIEAALRQVVDPEVALTIVDVGLVYAVSDRQEGTGPDDMTSAACRLRRVISRRIELDRVVPTDFGSGRAFGGHLGPATAWVPGRRTSGLVAHTATRCEIHRTSALNAGRGPARGF
jgi:hypothetical protein